MRHTEKTMQSCLAAYRRLSCHGTIPALIPNACISGHNAECDMIEVRKSGFWDEYEIKISRADFKADFTGKKHKHACMNGYFGKTYDRGPNFFWYVVPDGLIEESEVPDYAGLIYVKNDPPEDLWNTQYFKIAKTIRDAPRLHRGKLDENRIENLMRMLSRRLWKRELFQEPPMKETTRRGFRRGE